MTGTAPTLGDIGHPRRDGASLRDPAGYVFELDGGVYRRLHGPAAQAWSTFAATPTAARLMQEGRLVATEPAAGFDLRLLADLDVPGAAAPGEVDVVLSHERIPVISYAQEWSFSMLRDAAMLHLDLMDTLLPQGWTLKDANPANVQWKDGRPCLIDVASIEPYRAGPWRAYGQFCKTMLFPLLVSAHAGLALQPLLKGHGSAGMDAATASRLLRGRATLKTGVWMHVRLQSWLQRFSDRRGAGGKPLDLSGSVQASAVLRMIQGLKRVLAAMPGPSRTAWTEYRSTSTYTDGQLRDKHDIVERWCAAHMGAEDLALDVGCNTGVYSGVLARHAGRVVSIDADMPCIDEIYGRGDARVLPLVVDFASQTPPGGWALAEQRAFKERVRPTWSIWLAVIHHLAVHNGVRLDEVVRRMAETSKGLIVEFVAPGDEMVRALLAERGIDRPDYTEAHFLRLLACHDLRILAREVVTPNRTLYLIEQTR